MPAVRLRAEHDSRLLQLGTIHFPVGRLTDRDPTVRHQIFELQYSMFHFDFLRREDFPELRTGTFTSGIVSIVDAWRIVLLFTGPKHAGENVAEVLKQRDRGLPAVIQTCDALSRKRPKLEEIKTLLANCLAHERRQFVEVAENFPQECRHLLGHSAASITMMRWRGNGNSLLKQRFHQEHSGPVMRMLHEWMKAQLAGRRTEPNSGLGKAISYLLNHWTKLTLFFRSQVRRSITTSSSAP